VIVRAAQGLLKTSPFGFSSLVVKVSECTRPHNLRLPKSLSTDINFLGGPDSFNVRLESSGAPQHPTIFSLISQSDDTSDPSDSRSPPIYIPCQNLDRH
jgi:hypothetical protein